VNKAWLEPLLSHIKNDRRNVAIPIIDIINQDSFAVEASPLVRGGFNWGLFYRWDPVPQSTLRANDSFISPIKYMLQLYLSHWSNFSLPLSGAEYCDEHVCLCLCASTSLELHVQTSPNFLCLLPVVVNQSSSVGTATQLCDWHYF